MTADILVGTGTQECAATTDPQRLQRMARKRLARGPGLALLRPGDFQSKDNPYQVWRLRYDFLNRLGELVPEAVDELEINAIPAYRRAVGPALETVWRLAALEDPEWKARNPSVIPRWRSEIAPDWERPAPRQSREHGRSPRVELWADAILRPDPRSERLRNEGSAPRLPGQLVPVLSVLPPEDAKVVTERLESLERILTDWATAHRVLEGWVLDRLLGHIHDEAAAQGAFPAWFFTIPRPPNVPWPNAFEISVPTWNPLLETRAEAQKRIFAEVKKQVTASLNEVEEQAEVAGLERVVEKRPRPKKSRRRPDRFLHLEWLVRYQVQGWTYDKIRKEYDLRSIDSVARACRDTAKLLGLTTRAQHRYRPPDLG